MCKHRLFPLAPYLRFIFSSRHTFPVIDKQRQCTTSSKDFNFHYRTHSRLLVFFCLDFQRMNFYPRNQMSGKYSTANRRALFSCKTCIVINLILLPGIASKSVGNIINYSCIFYFFQRNDISIQGFYNFAKPV